MEAAYRTEWHSGACAASINKVQSKWLSALGPGPGPGPVSPDSKAIRRKTGARRGVAAGIFMIL